MSRESVPCVTRTFMCDSLRRSSSWLEMGSLETNFRICPCRNRLCTFSAMVDLTLCTHLHNYARSVGPLSILFCNISKHFLFEPNAPLGLPFQVASTFTCELSRGEPECYSPNYERCPHART